MTIPAIVAGHTTKQDGSATTSRTITTPTYSSGDEIFLFIATSSTSANIASSGFTALPNYGPATLSGGEIWILKKTAASEGASYTITSASTIVSAIAVAISPYGGIHAVGTNATGTSATATAPAVTTYLANTLRISVIATDDSPGVTSVATLTGHTLLATVTGSSKPTVSVQYKDLTGTGSDSSQTSALSGSETWTGITFAIHDLVEARATKAGVYVETIDAQVNATKAGIYVELGDAALTATKAGIYLEITAIVAPDGDPSGLTATAASASQINLSWTDNSTNEDGFQIERSPDNSTWSLIHTTAANVTSYNNTGLSEATQYYYRVRATNTAGNSNYTSSANATTYPAAPSSLTATAISYSQIDLSWTDNSSGETGFKIERSPDNSAWTQIDTNAANDTTYSDTTVSPSTLYYYRVRAYNGSGNSSYTSSANATTPSAGPDGDPSGLTATAISSSRIDLAWTDGSTNEDGFEIDRSPDGSTWTLIHTTAANATSYSNTSLSEGTTYYYRVRATNTGGDSNYTSTASALTYPTAPTSLDAVQNGSTQVDLTWTDNSSTETGYHVERSATGSGGWSVIATKAANSTSHSDTGLSPGATWYYRVGAYNATGDSYSNTDSATTLNPPNAAPSGLVATAVSSSRIDLTWSDNSTNETGFEVERSPTGSGSWTLITTTAAEATSYGDTGLTEATTYYYRVRAVNSGGSSGYTSTANALTYPAAPSGLAALASSDIQIDLTWTENSAGETGVKVERSATGAGSWSVIATLAANTASYSNTGLSAGQTWYYRVGAYNGSGTSYGSNANATTAAVPQMNYDIRAQVYFDWDRDGNYTSEDDYLISARGTHRIAPPGQSITATSGQVAQCTVVMDNSTGRFSSLKAAGPLYAVIYDGHVYHVPVIVQISVEEAGAVSATYSQVFNGVARIPVEITLSPGTPKTITFDCRGNEEVILNKRARTLQADFKGYRDDGITEAEFIEALTADWLIDTGGGTQVIDDGLFTIPWAWLEKESIVEICWQLAAACGGRFYCNTAGQFVYESATSWLTGTRHTTSQASYTRGAGYNSLEMIWDETELAEEVSVSWTEREVGQTATIYDSDNLQVGAGIEKTIYANFDSAVYEITALNWTAGSPGGADLSANVTVTPTYYAQSAKIVVENTGTIAANVRIKVEGKPVEDGESKTISPETVDSFWSDKFGRSRSVSGNRWIQSEAQADMLAQFLRARMQAPTMLVRLKGCAGFPERRLGDRITVTDSEILLGATSFYITSISWSYSSKGFIQDLEAVRCSDLFPHESTSPGYFVIGTNKLGSADSLRGRVFF